MLAIDLKAGVTAEIADTFGSIFLDRPAGEPRLLLDLPRLARGDELVIRRDGREIRLTGRHGRESTKVCLRLCLPDSAEVIRHTAAGPVGRKGVEL